MPTLHATVTSVNVQVPTVHNPKIRLLSNSDIPENLAFIIFGAILGFLLVLGLIITLTFCMRCSDKNKTEEVIEKAYNVISVDPIKEAKLFYYDVESFVSFDTTLNGSDSEISINSQLSDFYAPIGKKLTFNNQQINNQLTQNNQESVDFMFVSPLTDLKLERNNPVELPALPKYDVNDLSPIQSGNTMVNELMSPKIKEEEAKRSSAISFNFSPEKRSSVFSGLIRPPSQLLENFFDAGDIIHELESNGDEPQKMSRAERRLSKIYSKAEARRASIDQRLKETNLIQVPKERNSEEIMKLDERVSIKEVIPIRRVKKGRSSTQGVPISRLYEKRQQRRLSQKPRLKRISITKKKFPPYPRSSIGSDIIPPEIPDIIPSRSPKRPYNPADYLPDSAPTKNKRRPSSYLSSYPTVSSADFKDHPIRIID